MCCLYRSHLGASGHLKQTSNNHWTKERTKMEESCKLVDALCWRGRLSPSSVRINLKLLIEVTYSGPFKIIS